MVEEMVKVEGVHGGDRYGVVEVEEMKEVEMKAIVRVQLPQRQPYRGGCCLKAL